jgi:hypothetical protein
MATCPPKTPNPWTNHPDTGRRPEKWSKIRTEGVKKEFRPEKQAFSRTKRFQSAEGAYFCLASLKPIL